MPLKCAVSFDLIIYIMLFHQNYGTGLESEIPKTWPVFMSSLHAELCISKPYVISFLEQGKEPGKMKNEMTAQVSVEKPGRGILSGSAIFKGDPPHLCLLEVFSSLPGLGEY